MISSFIFLGLTLWGIAMFTYDNIRTNKVLVTYNCTNNLIFDDKVELLKHFIYRALNPGFLRIYPPKIKRNRKFIKIINDARMVAGLPNMGGDGGDPTPSRGYPPPHVGVNNFRVSKF